MLTRKEFAKLLLGKSLVFLSILLVFPSLSEGVLKRCFQCRSRGELGSCKDSFNSTLVEGAVGIQAIPCASGWCGKFLEGGINQFKDAEYGVATERTCLQRGPPDNEERCAPTVYGHTKVHMCICQGDLCNSGHAVSATFSTAVMSFLSCLIILSQYLSSL